MKSLAIGCLGAILGLIIGAAILVLGSNWVNKPFASSVSQSAARPDLAVTASAAFLSSQLQQSLRANNLTKNATVTFASPNLVRIAANTQTNALGFSLNANVTLVQSITVQNGRVALKVESVDTGGLPVPLSTLDAGVERLRAQAEEQINRSVQNMLRGSNLRITNIRITENDLTVEMSGQ